VSAAAKLPGDLTRFPAVDPCQRMQPPGVMHYDKHGRVANGSPWIGALHFRALITGPLARRSDAFPPPLRERVS
jgi:hypothetical protein